MARRAGLTMYQIAHVEAELAAARRNQWDLYPSLSDMRFSIADSLAPAADRFVLHIRDRGTESRYKISPTALDQICAAASMPTGFLERVPANLALSLFRSLLEMSDLSDGRRVLIRLKNHPVPTVRALLPQSYVRLDDKDVFQELKAAVGVADVRVGRVSIDQDTLFLRVLFQEEVPLGPATAPDPVRGGFDIISSETGCHPLEVRHVLFRLFCSNGLTIPLGTPPNLMRARYTQTDREALAAMLRNALEAALPQGRMLAERMAATRSQAIEDPRVEICEIFRRYNLGNPRGKIGRWIANEVVQNLTLFGVRRFDIVQAFTAVARGLEHRDRMRYEDAMGAYLLEGDRRN